jgi:ribosome-associated translation inhibitor RaiA
VTVHGQVNAKLVALARRKVVRVMRYLKDPVLYARVTLRLEPDPARERPAIAQAMLDVNGRPVRAHASGADMREAVNRLEERLRRQLEILTEHREQQRKRGPAAREPHEWRHGDPPDQRTGFYPREAGQRQVVARAATVSRPLTPEEAADEMELLDYDFHLFTDVGTAAAATVWRDRGGAVGWTPLSAAPALTRSEAIAMLEASGEPFVFYRDTASGRGSVLYHRYDGHYGLLASPTVEVRS